MFDLPLRGGVGSLDGCGRQAGNLFELLCLADGRGRTKQGRRQKKVLSDTRANLRAGIASVAVLSAHYFPQLPVPEAGSVEWYERLAEIEYMEERLMNLQAGAIARAFGA